MIKTAPHRFVLLLPLILAGILFALAVSGALLGCQSEDVMTPAEKVELQRLDAELEATKAQLADAQAKAQAAAQEIGKPHESAADESAAFTAWSDARSKLLDLVDKAQKKDAQIQELVSAAQLRATAPVVGAAGALVPGWAPLIALGAQLGLPWLFDRSRKHLLESLKSGATGQLGTAVLAFGKALGYAHSNTDPSLILEGAAKMARDKGDTELEMAIRALRAGAFELHGPPANPTVAVASPVVLT